MKIKQTLSNLVTPTLLTAGLYLSMNFCTMISFTEQYKKVKENRGEKEAAIYAQRELSVTDNLFGKTLMPMARSLAQQQVDHYNNSQLEELN